MQPGSFARLLLLNVAAAILAAVIISQVPALRAIVRRDVES